MFLQITSDNFVAGVEVGVQAAPIIRYMEKWTEDQIAQFCYWKGWTITRVDKGTGSLHQRRNWISDDGTEVFSGSYIGEVGKESDA